MADARIRWDKPALYSVIGEGSAPLIRQATYQAANTANELSAGFRTGIWHDHKTKEKKGDTQPRYAADVEKSNFYYIGQVWTDNYAAARDNMENNTLLKAVPNV